MPEAVRIICRYIKPIIGPEPTRRSEQVGRKLPHYKKKTDSLLSTFLPLLPLKRRPLQCCVSLLQTTEVNKVFGPIDTLYKRK
jgi:hypothetical protein